MNITAGICETDIAERWLFHDLCKRIPGTDILPLPGEPLYTDIFFMFDNCIIKTDFRQIGIPGIKISIISEIQKLMGP